MPGSKAKGSSGPLDEYRAKRSAEATPEPFGSGTSRPGLFVVQKHAARQLHYDFRLEHEGVLLSWAVPKGPSFDPADKRLAMHVEDHPVEYADFEGIIPEGNYGAGAVIVWDRGKWLPLLDPASGMEKGKLLFELAGYKLHGVWTLVRTKRNPKEWLLIKERDAWATSKPGPLREESVLSGLTLEQLAEGHDRGEAILADIRAELVAAGAPQRHLDARSVGLMLAGTADAPFSAPGWIFELKYDGYRILAAREEDRPLLLYRRGGDATSAFPELARAVAALPPGVVLDGEVAVLDEKGHPRFQLLQQRALLTRPADVQRATVELPATFFAFDCLGAGDFDLRALPLARRKEILARVLPRAGPLRFADHVDERGAELFAEVRRLGLEGLIGKRADSAYRAGRSKAWLKLRVDRTGDFVVVGFTAPQGSRAGFGALHLAVHEAGRLVYAGSVGSGFTDRGLEEIRRTIEETRRDDAPCAGPTPAGRGHTWVEPLVVCEVRFKEWTDEGHLRHPVFLRLRDDKAPADCVREMSVREMSARGATAREDRSTPLAEATGQKATGPEASAAEAPGQKATGPKASVPEATPPAGREVPPPEPRTVPFTNLGKVFWPDDGYTKGDLIEFYRSVARWMLPYLEDRPLVLTRFPDGITGKSFFQKDAPGFVPAWLRTERIWSEHAQREIDYFVCDGEDSLLYLANMATIPIHVWSSRLHSIQRPDWCILDLDPKGAPFRHVVEVALVIRELCEEIGMPAFVKTSGSTGLHVLLPLLAQCTYVQSRTLGELLARLVVERLPDIATVARPIGSRGGRVYVDFGQNGHGRLLVAPLCVRPLPGAPVSTPLRWSEVGPDLDAGRFTIRTVPERLRAQGDDPLLRVLTERVDLGGVLSRLDARIRGG